MTETHKLSKELDYNQITDHIFIGTNMCCQTHFDEKLKDKGITADISLEADRIDAPYGATSFLWLPTINNTPPSPEQFEIGINALKKLEQLNIKVYVHCQFGHGRAPTLVAGYLIKEKGMSVDEAIGYIKTKRPVIHLEDVQIAALQELASKK
jgi:hypothetical protein